MAPSPPPKENIVSEDSLEPLEQDVIIKKIRKWLDLNAYNSLYNDMFKEGFCAGFATAWLYYAARGKIDYFYSLLKRIACWDESSHSCDLAFLEVCNFLFWFQSPETLLSNLFQPNIAEKMNIVLSKDTQIAPPEFQLSFLFTYKECCIFLNKLLETACRKMIFVTSGTHACGIYADTQGIYRFYNPNYQSGEVVLNTIEKLTQHVFKSLMTVSSDYVSISINVLDFVKNTPGYYQPLINYLPEGFQYHIKRRNAHITALFLAASYNQSAMVKLLLQQGANPDEGLWIAAAMGNNELVSQLLEAGADVNKINYDGFSPLMHAAYYGHLDTVKLLLEHGAYIDFHQKTSALIIAAQNGHIELVEYLLLKGATVSCRDEDSLQAIHVASFYGHKEIVNLLLRWGAKAIDTTRDGKTALYYALIANKEEVTKELIKDKAVVKVTLVQATKEKDVSIIKMLISQGQKIVLSILEEEQSLSLFFKKVAARTNTSEAEHTSKAGPRLR